MSLVWRAVRNNRTIHWLAVRSFGKSPAVIEWTVALNSASRSMLKATAPPKTTMQVANASNSRAAMGMRNVIIAR